MVLAVHVDTLTLAEIHTTSTNALRVLKWADRGLLPGEKRQERELQKRKKKNQKKKTGVHSAKKIKKKVE